MRAISLQLDTARGIQAGHCKPIIMGFDQAWGVLICTRTRGCRHQIESDIFMASIRDNIEGF